jgi:hypothetical protein
MPKSNGTVPGLSPEQQNEVIISLLARLVWPQDELVQLITEGRKNPQGYLKAYNALDGIKTGTQLASIAGVSKQAMSVTLQTWEDLGIVIPVGTARYRKLTSIPTKINDKGK